MCVEGQILLILILKYEFLDNDFKLLRCITKKTLAYALHRPIDHIGVFQYPTAVVHLTCTRRISRYTLINGNCFIYSRCFLIIF